MRYLHVTVALTSLTLSGCALAQSQSSQDVHYATETPTIDGRIDVAWERASWRPMDALILGELPSADDFSGRYKLLWRENALYLLAEIHDDQLVDARPDPLEAYWDDDALEVFIDADGARGVHLDDYRAFAYHIALDNQSVDIGPTGPAVFPDHVDSAWQRANESPHAVIWEAEIRIATATADGQTLTGFRQLETDEIIGFMLAYCDADDANGRQHFVGDITIAPVNGDRNLGYKDSSVFGSIRLIKHESQ
ncbi:MAG: sugar-binding protein [Pseudomonadota bacterium]